MANDYCLAGNISVRALEKALNSRDEERTFSRPSTEFENNTNCNIFQTKLRALRQFDRMNEIFYDKKEIFSTIHVVSENLAIYWISKGVLTTSENYVNFPEINDLSTSVTC
ncbi:hypothetical protein GQX74_011928 [Glossina fuscipes]|nr:hypothetical protein GQX74_011928 [Glossina fuscipes]